MEYSLYRLNFTTGLHIGKDTGGSSLDDGEMAIHADTIFAALCCEAARDDRLAQIVQYFTDGTLTISDALPYSGEEYYLPKPVLFLGSNQREGNPRLKKDLKSLPYIPLSRFQQYLQNLNNPEINIDELRCDFGQLTTSTRVAIKGHTPPLPYHVASWKFAPGCGLYIIVRYKEEGALAVFSSLLSNLGLSGIGGKRSSGWGKFETCQCTVPKELMELIADHQGEYQMLLGTGLPLDAELDEILQHGWYTIIRRGGFVNSENYAAGQMKKRTIYMLGPGSCLRKRFQGGMFDLSDNGAHPVYRNGNTLFVGVNL
jgi:CRISPR-associated protein Csm4